MSGILATGITCPLVTGKLFNNNCPEAGSETTVIPERGFDSTSVKLKLDIVLKIQSIS